MLLRNIDNQYKNVFVPLDIDMLDHEHITNYLLPIKYKLCKQKYYQLFKLLPVLHMHHTPINNEFFSHFVF